MQLLLMSKQSFARDNACVSPSDVKSIHKAMIVSQLQRIWHVLSPNGHLSSVCYCQHQKSHQVEAGLINSIQLDYRAICWYKCWTAICSSWTFKPSGLDPASLYLLIVDEPCAIML